MNLCSFVFLFKDTFRRERSLAYQRMLRRAQAQRAEDPPIPMHDVKEPVVTTGVDVAAGTDQSSATLLKLSARDVDPIMPMLRVLRSLNNPVILTASGFIYGFSYSILYTTVRALASGYHYNSLQTG